MVLKDDDYVSDKADYCPVHLTDRRCGCHGLRREALSRKTPSATIKLKVYPEP